MDVATADASDASQIQTADGAPINSGTACRTDYNVMFFQGPSFFGSPQGVSPADATWSASSSTSSTVQVDLLYDDGGEYSTTFSTGGIGGPLKMGDYDLAELSSTLGLPVVDVSGPSSCSTTNGTCAINAIEWDSQGQLQTFTAFFELPCESDASLELVGCLHYQNP